MIADLILTPDDYILSLLWVWVSFLDPNMNLENITWIYAWILAVDFSDPHHHWSPGRGTRSLGVTRQNLVNDGMCCWLFDGWDKEFQRTFEPETFMIQWSLSGTGSMIRVPPVVMWNRLCHQLCCDAECTTRSIVVTPIQGLPLLCWNLFLPKVRFK